MKKFGGHKYTLVNDYTPCTKTTGRKEGMVRGLGKVQDSRLNCERLGESQGLIREQSGELFVKLPVIDEQPHCGSLASKFILFN